MQTKVLIIAVIKKDNAVLIRKKLDGSPPYKETWYLFGAEATPDKLPDEALKEHVKQQAGINIAIGQKFSWDTEIKNDLDGIEKFFVYLDVLCEYESGELTLSQGVEKLEWVEAERLNDYDLVPPSIEVFKKLGYLEAHPKSDLNFTKTVNIMANTAPLSNEELTKRRKNEG